MVIVNMNNNSYLVLAVSPGEVLAVVLGVLGIGLLILYLFSIVWAYGDAQQRGKPGCLVALLVTFLSWPLGLLAWVIFRPDSSENAGDADNARIAFMSCTCGRHIPVEERLAGTKLTCVSCGIEVTVPELSQLRRIIAEEGFTQKPARR